MDKELLRIAIIGTGLIVMVAMIISAYLKDKQAREQDEYEEYDEEEFEEDEFDEKSEPVTKLSVVQTLKNAVAQKMQLHQPVHITPQFEDDHEHDVESDSESHKRHHTEKKSSDESARPAAALAILQFSVITRGNQDFNGADIFDELESLGLVYGSTKIFERIDENRFVHFGVASMVEPGTFPDTDLENFYCPGVVFFMQFDELENPKSVFEDYVATAALFADRMDGVVLDHRRQPLTNEMVDAILSKL